jgi:hypothetical protein
MGELIPLAAIVCIFGPALFIPITAMVLRSIAKRCWRWSWSGAG